MDLAERESSYVLVKSCAAMSIVDMYGPRSD